MKDLLIVDLEATCYARGEEPPDFFAEIIEIGAVRLDATSKNIDDEYQTFVKPVLFPSLSAFCTELTTITQADVDAGLPLVEALTLLASHYDADAMVFSSWGFYDQKQIARECERFSLPYPFADAHISIKHNHAKFYHLERPMGMDDALRYHSLPLLGTHHRGLDDARNIAQITAHMLADGWTHRLLV